uniref:AB hydrolase-1 domain-containing protein n=1 Tax=Monopterus albus TaxID=43700 RepID=A0A3Q3KB75_MONAL
ISQFSYCQEESSAAFSQKQGQKEHTVLESGADFVISPVAEMKRAVSFLITVYVSVPVILYLFPWILVRLPFFVDLGRPEDVLNHTCNFYLNTEEGISVGVWHTLPVSQWENAVGRSPEWYWETLGNSHPVIIYLHGNTGTRWDQSGYHVLSLDYRGFGDSTGEPSEAGLTSDALYLYHWVKKQSRGSLICLWGHSLGSGVATNAALKIQEQGECKSLKALHNHCSSTQYLYTECCKTICTTLSSRCTCSCQDLTTLTSSILILHSEDDNVVPYHMGVKVQYANLGFSHNNIYLDPNLPNVMR